MDAKNDPCSIKNICEMIDERINCNVFSFFQDGERGYLEGLASRYADTFNTHYGDVLEHLEELRRREWDEMSPRIRVLGAGTPDSPPAPAYSPTSGTPVGALCGGLTSSQSQPIYVPGKYSVSSSISVCTTFFSLLL